MEGPKNRHRKKIELFYDKDGHTMKQSTKTENCKKTNPLETMDDFFAARVDGYDEHMRNDVKGCADGYRVLAKLLPAHTGTLLDLGCGTGLELDEIFKTNPDIRVTGIDLTRAMLDRLKAKHPGRNLTLIHASYFDVNFGRETYDAVISFQTMHHFPHEKKLGLYKRICGALKSGGVYIEGDYMAATQEEEDLYSRENARIRREQHIPDGALYHYDIPCTVDHQTALLRAAGFRDVRAVWRMENTTIVVAKK